MCINACPKIAHLGTNQSETIMITCHSMSSKYSYTNKHILFLKSKSGFHLVLGEWSVEDLWAGDGELPEQVPPDPWLGRPLQQGEGAHQQCQHHEALSLIQGKVYRDNLIDHIDFITINDRLF